MKLHAVLLELHSYTGYAEEADLQCMHVDPVSICDTTNADALLKTC